MVLIKLKIEAVLVTGNLTLPFFVPHSKLAHMLAVVCVELL